jgi:hypothetical protein
MINRVKFIAVICSVVLVCITASAGLLSNGGFEVQDGVDSWNAADWNQGGNQGRTDWANEPGSSWGLAFYGWTNGGSGFFEQNLPCDTNATYYFRIRGLRERNFDSGDLSMELRFFPATNWISIVEYTNSSVNLSSPTNWTTYELEGGAPVGAGVVQVHCEFSGAVDDSPGFQAFRWDNATLYDRRKNYRAAEIMDEFSYDPDFDDGLKGKDRGHGFSGSWSNLWGNADVADYSFPSVVGYPRPYGNKLHLWNTGGAVYRSFPAVTNGRIYAAAYFNYGNERTNNWAGISFLSNTVERVFFGGNSYAQAKMKLAIDSFGGSNRVDSAYEMNAGIGQDYIIIGRYDFDSHEFSTKAYYKTDAIPLLEPKDWDLTVTLRAERICSLNGIRLACGGVNPGDVYFDEVRVAGNWFDLLNNDEPPPVGMFFSVR